MKKIVGVVLLVLVGVLSGYGQRISRVASGLDIGTGFASGGQFAPFFTTRPFIPPMRPGLNERGVRVSSYFANDIQLTATAVNSKEEECS